MPLNVSKAIDNEIANLRAHGAPPAHIVLTAAAYSLLDEEDKGPNGGFLSPLSPFGDRNFRGFPLVVIGEVSRFSPLYVAGPISDEVRFHGLKEPDEP